MNYDIKDLRRACLKNAYIIYDKDAFDLKHERLDYELSRVASVSGGADTFFEVADYIRKIKNLYLSVYGKDLEYTFRGPVSSGLISYLLGISRLDPIACGFYSWAFFIKEKNLEFNLNLSKRAYATVSGYGIYPPACIKLYSHADLDLLEETASSLAPACRDKVVKDFFESYRDRGDYSVFGGFNAFDERYVPHAQSVIEYLRSIRLLPESLDDLVKLIGFLHSTLINFDHMSIIMRAPSKLLYNELISCPEDIYERLIRNKLPDCEAEFISKCVQRAGSRIWPADLKSVYEACGTRYSLQMQNIDHLFYRSQLYENSCVTADLMFFHTFSVTT